MKSEKSMQLPLDEISDIFKVRRISQEDFPPFFQLCKGNPLYYEHMNTTVTPESLSQDIAELLPGKNHDDKYFIGFYKQEQLIAVMDIVMQYPDKHTAYIGFFMTDKQCQGKGIGTEIITQTASFLEKHDISFIELSYVKGNIESDSFWLKNGFLRTGKESKRESFELVSMKKTLN